MRSPAPYFFLGFSTVSLANLPTKSGHSRTDSEPDSMKLIGGGIVDAAWLKFGNCSFGGID